MERNVEFKNFDASYRVRKLIDQLTTKLEKATSTFSPELFHLRLMVEQNSVRSLYIISISVDFPRKTLAAKEEQHDWETGIRRAFAEIERQVERYKANLRGEHWKRPERRKEVREIRNEAASSVVEKSKRELFFSLVTPHLQRLHHFIRHLITYSEAMGDLVAGELTPQDVLDATVVRGYREFLRGRSIPDVKNSLIRLAIDQLDADVARRQTARARPGHIEEGVPQTSPPEQVSTLGDEILDFYQTDEDLKLEDLIPDLETRTPEDELEIKELRGSVKRALAEMPREWWRILLLHNIDGRSRGEIARNMGKTDAQIDRTLQSASEYLRQKLVDSGFRFKPSQERDVA